MSLFYYRFIGILQLNPKAYLDISKQSSASFQAALVLILASFSTGIGVAGGYQDKILRSGISALLAWSVLVGIVLLSSLVLNRSQPSIQWKGLFRMTAYATAPGIFRGFAFFPPFSAIASVGTSFWSVATLIVCMQLIHPKANNKLTIPLALVASASYQYLIHVF